MTKICKKAAQHFHCAVSKVFDRVKSVALWSANIRKLTRDHKGYGSAATFFYTYLPVFIHLQLIIITNISILTDPAYFVLW
jgi:hypothetical protein